MEYLKNKDGKIRMTDTDEKVPKKCPKYGDLIDRDRTIDRAKVDGARAALIYEPTVIEAEGE